VLIATALTEDDGVVPLRRTYAGGLTYGLDEELTILDIARSDGDGTTATARVEAAGYGLPASPQGRPSLGAGSSPPGALQIKSEYAKAICNLGTAARRHNGGVDTLSPWHYTKRLHQLDPARYAATRV
jgi:hypothetical protein